MDSLRVPALTACYSFDGRTWWDYSPRQLEEWEQQFPGKDLFVAPLPPSAPTRQERYRAHRDSMAQEAARLMAVGANVGVVEVKALRDCSGAPVMDCRNALIVAEGDQGNALEMLLIKSAELSVGVR